MLSVLCRLQSQREVLCERRESEREGAACLVNGFGGNCSSFFRGSRMECCRHLESCLSLEPRGE